MRNLLRKLERELAAERTELAVLPPVNELLSRWEEALCQNRATPDTLSFALRSIKPGFCLTTVPRALNYLDTCRGKTVLPNKETLVDILVHGSLGNPFTGAREVPRSW